MVYFYIHYPFCLAYKLNKAMLPKHLLSLPFLYGFFYTTAAKIHFSLYTHHICWADSFKNTFGKSVLAYTKSAKGMPGN